MRAGPPAAPLWRTSTSLSPVALATVCGPGTWATATRSTAKCERPRGGATPTTYRHGYRWRAAPLAHPASAGLPSPARRPCTAGLVPCEPAQLPFSCSPDLTQDLTQGCSANESFPGLWEVPRESQGWCLKTGAGMPALHTAPSLPAIAVSGMHVLGHPPNRHRARLKCMQLNQTDTRSCAAASRPAPAPAQRCHLNPPMQCGG